MTEPKIILIQDSRERLGYTDLFESRCVVDTLAVGDYSIAGLTQLIAVERKSLADLLMSLTHERDRFERELARARALQRFYVIVEADARDVLAGRFGPRSQANPKAIWETIACFSVRYAPFLFCGDRRAGARLTESLLLKFAREYRVTVEKLDRASREIQRAV